MAYLKQSLFDDVISSCVSEGLTVIITEFPILRNSSIAQRIAVIAPAPSSSTSSTSSTSSSSVSETAKTLAVDQEERIIPQISRFLFNLNIFAYSLTNVFAEGKYNLENVHCHPFWAAYAVASEMGTNRLYATLIRIFGGESGMLALNFILLFVNIKFIKSSGLFTRVMNVVKA